MKFNMFDKVLSAVKDYHLPALLGMFGVGAVLSWFHHLDMAFVSYAGIIVGGITGHSFSPAGAPDPSVKEDDAIQKP